MLIRLLFFFYLFFFSRDLFVMNSHSPTSPCTSQARAARRVRSNRQSLVREKSAHVHTHSPISHHSFFPAPEYTAPPSHPSGVKRRRVIVNIIWKKKKPMSGGESSDEEPLFALLKKRRPGRPPGDCHPNRQHFSFRFVPP